MPRSGNREDIETETREEPLAETKTETKEIHPFKKPITLLQEHIKVTSIKETLEKNKPVSQENDTPTAEPTVEVEKTETQEPQKIEAEAEIQYDEKIYDTEIESSEEQEIVYASLQDCWVDAIKESSNVNTIIAEELLLKHIPVGNENYIIEIEVPNEVAKQEIREILPTLSNCLGKKTGIPYSFDIKVVKTVYEKQVDKANPDEKFIHLCKENPKLMEFKQRLNISIS